ncbi:MAG: aldo/keto reductase [Chloroflexi bacterium]|jgi:aryl-alcohol dehydrogenase-like predicted oxidoreductase|nr:aldo/keto reductase [Chloroflexota bacterium]
MEYRELGNTGLEVSAISFGASSLGSVFRQINESDGIRTVRMAVDLGINFIDVSPYYGLTKAETVLGKALQQIPRDSYYLATKVGRYGERIDAFDFSAERVTASVDESLARLQVETIDIIQCHDIEFGDLDQVVDETIPALRRLQEAGKVRFVGITALPLNAFRYVLDRIPVDTILSYCRYSLNDTGLLSLVPLCEEKGTGIINASPLSMGLLTNRGTPDWHPAPDDIKNACAEAARFCDDKGVDIAQLAVQFSVAHPAFATTIVGTANPDNIVKNVSWAQTPIDQDLLADVQAILAPIQNKTWPSGRPENN